MSIVFDVIPEKRRVSAVIVEMLFMEVSVPLPTTLSVFVPTLMLPKVLICSTVIERFAFDMMFSKLVMVAVVRSNAPLILRVSPTPVFIPPSSVFPMEFESIVTVSSPEPVVIEFILYVAPVRLRVSSPLPVINSSTFIFAISALVIVTAPPSVVTKLSCPPFPTIVSFALSCAFV